MMRFTDFERLGVSVAAMSDRSDGDCRRSDLPDGNGCAAFCISLGLHPDRLVRAAQVHGASIARAAAKDSGRGAVPGVEPFPETDAIITDVPGLPIGVTIADCVPLWIFDPVTRSGGIVHAGRIGTYNNIAGAAVAALQEAYGATPENVHALIGPSAGPNAYEVSEEIAQDFAAAGLAVRGRMVDLWESNALCLSQAGVPRSNISVSGICTITDGRFHSHRAHENGMRNLAILVL